MAVHWLLSVLFLAAILAIGVSLHQDQGSKRSGGDAEDESWDYFLFVQTSPAGNCYFKHDEDCAYPSNSTPWTMHGIWPTKNGTLGPNDCTKVTFSLSEVEDILPQLVSQWPNILTNTPFDSFWEHEWVKHGSCALEINTMSNEHSFFSTTLKLHEEHDITAMLEKHGIKPSYDHHYKTEEFNEVFMDEMGVKPLLECLYSPDMGQVLYQVSVCLRKDFSLMPCEAYVFDSSHTKCYDSQTFLYIPKKTTN